MALGQDPRTPPKPTHMALKAHTSTQRALRAGARHLRAIPQYSRVLGGSSTVHLN